MNATKRKFNALLNGLGNKSTSSLNSLDVNNSSTPDLSTATTLNADNAGKKRRIAHPISSLISTSSSTSRTPLTDSVATRPSGSRIFIPAVASSAPEERPKYAPWDRVAFLERLKSFSNLTNWTPKPAKVNEVEWAKRGWVCQKFERVRCCLCNVEILVKLNKKEIEGKEEPVYVASQIEDALVDRYAEMIVVSHAESCLWRERGCDETIFKLSLQHAPTTRQAIRHRYDTLCHVKPLLPYLHNLQTPDSFDLNIILSYLPPDFFKTIHPTSEPASDAAPEVDKVAIIMALFGWRSRPEHMPQHGAAQCESCFRTLGLWLFKSKEMDSAGNVIQPASMDKLDVVNEHRDYCPWRNATAQSGSGKAVAAASSPSVQSPAWEVVVRVLKNEYYLRNGGKREKAAPVTPSRPVTVGGGTGQLDDPFGADEDAADAQSIREEKDKERWARLKRVKSMFEPNRSKKLQRPVTADPKKAA